MHPLHRIEKEYALRLDTMIVVADMDEIAWRVLAQW
jgi:hypothetical protein